MAIDVLNHITIMGRLGADPEVQQAGNGVLVAKFRLAVDRDFKDKTTGEKATDWFNCVAWRQTAEFVGNYFAKGRMAVVEGRLQMRDWTDKNGNKRRSAEVVADNVYFGDSKRDGDGGGYNQAGYSQPDGYNQAGYAPPSGGYPAQPDPDSEFRELTTDDGNLPF